MPKWSMTNKGNIVQCKDWIIEKPSKKDIKNYEKQLKRHSSIKKICYLCGSEFYGAFKYQKHCKCCKLYIKCKNCGEYFILKDPTKINLDFIKNKENYDGFCSKFCLTQFKHKNKLFKYKCENCGKYIKSKFSKCEYCGFDFKNNIEYKCQNCGEKIKTPSSRCNHCGFLNGFHDGGFTYRNKFYNDKFNIISFNSLKYEIKFEDFYILEDKIGVWARWTDENHENYCLDVCKTVDIGKEMLSSLRSFDSLIKDPNQPLDKGWKKKYKNQLIDAGAYDKENPGKINFILVAICKTEEEALMIETQYAHDNKAKYWSPEPGQRM